MGRDSFLSLYSELLRTRRNRDRIPVAGRFSAPIQTGPGSHPDSKTMGTGSYPGVKRPGRGVDHPSRSSAEVKERLKLYIYFFFWAFLDSSNVNFTFNLYLSYSLHKADSLHVGALEWRPPVVQGTTTMKSTAFCNMTSCILVEIKQLFLL